MITPQSVDKVLFSKNDADADLFFSISTLFLAFFRIYSSKYTSKMNFLSTF